MEADILVMESQLVDFSVVKRKIIATDEVLNKYLENYNKLKKNIQTNKELKSQLERSQLELERSEFSQKMIQSKYNDLESKYNVLADQMEDLQRKYGEQLISSQTTIQDMEIELSMYKELSENSSNAGMTMEELKKKLKEHQETEEEISKDNLRLEKEISSLQQQITGNKEEYDKKIQALNMEKEEISSRLCYIQTEQKEQLKKHAEVCHFKDMKINQLERQLPDVRALQDLVKLLTFEKEQLKQESIHKYIPKSAVSIGSQTDLISEPFFSNNLEFGESDMFLCDIFKEMINYTTMLSPLRSSSPQIECCLDNIENTSHIAAGVCSEEIKENNALLLKENDISINNASYENSIAVSQNIEDDEDYMLVDSGISSFCTPMTPLSDNNKDYLSNKSDVNNFEDFNKIKNKQRYKKARYLKQRRKTISKMKNLLKRKKKTVNRDPILSALKVLKQSNINFIISNEEIFSSGQNKSIKKVCQQLKIKTLDVEYLTCTQISCQQSCMLVEDGCLLGFFESNKNTQHSNEKTSIESKHHNLISDLTNTLVPNCSPEVVLDKLAELVSEKLKHKKTYWPSTECNSEYLSESEAELRSLFSSSVLDTNGVIESDINMVDLKLSNEELIPRNLSAEITSSTDTSFVENKSISYSANSDNVVSTCPPIQTESTTFINQHTVDYNCGRVTDTTEAPTCEYNTKEPKANDNITKMIVEDLSDQKNENHDTIDTFLGLDVRTDTESDKKSIYVKESCVDNTESPTIVETEGCQSFTTENNDNLEKNQLFEVASKEELGLNHAVGEITCPGNLDSATYDTTGNILLNIHTQDHQDIIEGTCLSKQPPDKLQSQKPNTVDLVEKSESVVSTKNASCNQEKALDLVINEPKVELLETFMLPSGINSEQPSIKLKRQKPNTMDLEEKSESIVSTKNASFNQEKALDLVTNEPKVELLETSVSSAIDLSCLSKQPPGTLQSQEPYAEDLVEKSKSIISTTNASCNQEHPLDLVINETKEDLLEASVLLLPIDSSDNDHICCKIGEDDFSKTLQQQYSPKIFSDEFDNHFHLPLALDEDYNKELSHVPREGTNSIDLSSDQCQDRCLIRNLREFNHKLDLNLSFSFEEGDDSETTGTISRTLSPKSLSFPFEENEENESEATRTICRTPSPEKQNNYLYMMSPSTILDICRISPPPECISPLSSNSVLKDDIGEVESKNETGQVKNIDLNNESMSLKQISPLKQCMELLSKTGEIIMSDSIISPTSKCINYILKHEQILGSEIDSFLQQFESDKSFSDLNNSTNAVESPNNQGVTKSSFQSPPNRKRISEFRSPPKSSAPVPTLQTKTIRNLTNYFESVNSEESAVSQPSPTKNVTQSCSSAFPISSDSTTSVHIPTGLAILATKYNPALSAKPSINVFPSAATSHMQDSSSLEIEMSVDSPIPPITRPYELFFNPISLPTPKVTYGLSSPVSSPVASCPESPEQAEVLQHETVYPKIIPLEKVEDSGLANETKNNRKCSPTNSDSKSSEYDVKSNQQCIRSKYETVDPKITPLEKVEDDGLANETKNKRKYNDSKSSEDEVKNNQPCIRSKYGRVIKVKKYPDFYDDIEEFTKCTKISSVAESEEKNRRQLEAKNGSKSIEKMVVNKVDETSCSEHVKQAPDPTKKPKLPKRLTRLQAKMFAAESEEKDKHKLEAKNEGESTEKMLVNEVGETSCSEQVIQVSHLAKKPKLAKQLTKVHSKIVIAESEEKNKHELEAENESESLEKMLVNEVDETSCSEQVNQVSHPAEKPKLAKNLTKVHSKIVIAESEEKNKHELEAENESESLEKMLVNEVDETSCSEQVNQVSHPAEKPKLAKKLTKVHSKMVVAESEEKNILELEGTNESESTDKMLVNEVDETSCSEHVKQVPDPANKLKLDKKLTKIHSKVFVAQSKEKNKHELEATNESESNEKILLNQIYETSCSQQVNQEPDPAKKPKLAKKLTKVHSKMVVAESEEKNILELEGTNESESTDKMLVNEVDETSCSEHVKQVPDPANKLKLDKKLTKIHSKVFVAESEEKNKHELEATNESESNEKILLNQIYETSCSQQVNQEPDPAKKPKLAKTLTKVHSKMFVSEPEEKNKLELESKNESESTEKMLINQIEETSCSEQVNQLSHPAKKPKLAKKLTEVPPKRFVAESEEKNKHELEATNQSESNEKMLLNQIDETSCSEQVTKVLDPAKKPKIPKKLTKLQSSVKRQMKHKQVMFRQPVGNICDNKLYISNHSEEMESETSNKKIKIVQNVLIRPNASSPIDLMESKSWNSGHNTNQTKPEPCAPQQNTCDVLSSIIGQMDKIRSHKTVIKRGVATPKSISEKEWRNGLIDIAETIYNRDINMPNIHGIRSFKKIGLLKRDSKVSPKIGFLLKKFYDLPSDIVLPEYIIVEFGRLPVDYIIDIIIHQLPRDKDKPEEDCYPAPLMTPTQRKFLRLLIQLEPKRINIIERFYCRIQYYVCRNDDVALQTLFTTTHIPDKTDVKDALWRVADPRGGKMRKSPPLTRSKIK
uniref:Uncharacterized protein LOC114332647 n=1 Tax=Diabrotica virgifera virgifera TaxID=50390 RepID=A0A6P7G0T9_DIAVI